MRNFLILAAVVLMFPPALFAEESMGQEIKQEALKIDRKVKKALGKSKAVVNSEFCESGEETCSAPMKKSAGKTKKTVAPVPENKDQVD